MSIYTNRKKATADNPAIAITVTEKDASTTKPKLCRLYERVITPSKRASYWCPMCDQTTYHLPLDEIERRTGKRRHNRNCISFRPGLGDKIHWLMTHIGIAWIVYRIMAKFQGRTPASVRCRCPVRIERLNRTGDRAGWKWTNMKALIPSSLRLLGLYRLPQIKLKTKCKDQEPPV